MSESENRRPRSSRSQPSREGARREDRETGGYRRDDRGESRGEGRGGPRGGDRRGGGGRRDDRRSTGASREAGRSRGDGPAADRRGTGPGELRPDQNPNRPPRKPRVPEPPLPDDVTGQELDRSVHHQLRTLTKENAEGVARHLVMVAATLAADETQLALAHAETAVRRAGRVPAAREALGMVAYRMGDYNRALGEFRTVRRLSGSSHLLALMVDCERGLGRFDRALELASSPEARTLTAAEREELTIVVSGVRRDMGQDAAALVALQGPGLRRKGAFRLQYAYADTLAALGRADEALDWFTRAALGDVEGETDAVERVEELQGTVQTDLLEGDDSEESGAEDSLGTEDPDVR